MRKSIAIGLFLALTLTGCGYTLSQNPVISSVRIGKIENRTQEPGLTSRIVNSLARALSAEGIMPSESALHTIEGTIDNIAINQLVARDGTPVLLEITIKGTFSLLKPDGTRMALGSDSPYIVTVESAERIALFLARESTAKDRAIAEITAEAIASMLDKIPAEPGR